MKLSVVLSTLNEGNNIALCLEAIKSIADEIIVFDEESTDKTKEIAESLGAKVYTVKHEPIFHITKQKAIDKATGDWILQLDADEVVTTELANEIVEIINSSNDKLLTRVLSLSTIQNPPSTKSLRLFIRHQSLIEQRDGKIGKPTGEVVAFFIPRMNIFLGRPLIHGGVYPDPAIRLVKRNKAWLPAKDVHEIMEADGEVGWLYNYMEHYDSPTFERYLARNNRYTDLIAKDLAKQKVPANLMYFALYTIYKPLYTFLDLYFRHKAVLDGFPGFVWSLFSALRFPISYMKYWQTQKS